MEDTWAWFFRFLWAVEDVYFGNDGTCSTNWIYLNSIPRMKIFSLLVQNVTGYLNICMKEGFTSRATGTITGSLVFLPNESWWTTVYDLDMYALTWGSRVYSILPTFFIPLITKFVFSCSLFVYQIKITKQRIVNLWPPKLVNAVDLSYYPINRRKKDASYQLEMLCSFASFQG